jgi:hypothetical protein
MAEPRTMGWWMTRNGWLQGMMTTFSNNNFLPPSVAFRKVLTNFAS